MCKFFSAISDGKGNVKFFTIEDVVKIMCDGNKDNLNFNSHTSIAFYNGIKGTNEDKWNKWEYDVNKKMLNIDSLVTKDDSKKVKQTIEKYLKDKDIIYLQNLYNYNSGNWNSGDGVINFLCNKQIFVLFNKSCDEKDIEYAKEALYPVWVKFDLTQWINSGSMTDEEKQNNPSHTTAGGYLKKYSYKEAWTNAFSGLSSEEKNKIKKIKNFDKQIFKDITGIEM